MEKQLRYAMAYQWFCGFSAFEQTPDHSFFSRFRKQIGTKQLAKVFQIIVDKANDQHLIRSVFHLVMQPALSQKNTPWAERDAAIQAGEQQLNNQTVKQHSADKQARFGCKGKQKFWFGYGAMLASIGSGLMKKPQLHRLMCPIKMGLNSSVLGDGQLVFGDEPIV